MTAPKEPTLIEFDSGLEVIHSKDGYTTIPLKKVTDGKPEVVAYIRCKDEAAKQMADVIHVALHPPI
jgi:hypothetical protein